MKIQLDYFASAKSLHSQELLTLKGEWVSDGQLLITLDSGKKP